MACVWQDPRENRVREAPMLPAFALVLAASPNIHAALDEPIKALPAALNQNLARVEIDRQLSQPCRKLGVKIAIDDFDGKYSSFEYIRTYRVNHLKFAQDFVRKPTHDPASAATTRAIGTFYFTSPDRVPPATVL